MSISSGGFEAYVTFRSEWECGEEPGKANEDVGSTNDDVKAVKASSDKESASVDPVCYCEGSAAVFVCLARGEQEAKDNGSEGEFSGC